MAFLLSVALGARVAAQESRGALRGTVVDEEGHAVVGALVQVDGANLRWSQRSGDLGQFLFPRLGTGGWTLSATAVGYATSRLSISVADSTVLLTVPLRALAVSMPVVPHAGKRTGVVGMLVSRNGLAPVPDASVTFVGSGTTARTEGHGLFFVGDIDPVPAVVLVRHAGYIDTFQSVSVVRDTLAQMLFVLDSVTADPEGSAQASMREFEERIARKSAHNLLLPRGPAFEGYAGAPLRQALYTILTDQRLMVTRQLSIDFASVCILAFTPPPTIAPLDLDDVDPADIDAVEVYDRSTDAVHRLRMRMSQDDAFHCQRDGGVLVNAGTPFHRPTPFDPFVNPPQRGISSGPLLVVWMKSPDRWRQ